MNKVILLLAIFLTSCTTSLWAPDYRTEYIDGFYINQTTNELFVSTDVSAYLFPISGEFAEALRLSREIEFGSYFSAFEVDKNHQVSGTANLMLRSEDPSQEVLETLSKLGFKKAQYVPALEISEALAGRRYVVDGDLPLEKLAKKITIRVMQPKSFAGSVRRILATPATIVVDSVVVVPATFLAATVMAVGSP